MAEKKKTLIRCTRVEISVEMQCGATTADVLRIPASGKCYHNISQCHIVCVQATPYENTHLLRLNSHVRHNKNIWENIITTFA